MKYCPGCGSEYRDDVARCSDDDQALVTAEQMRRLGMPLPGEPDLRVFAPVGSAEDPLSAERLVAALAEERIDAFLKARRAGTVDSITSGSSGPWWEIWAPEADAERSAGIIAREKQAIEASAAEAGQAAEDEEAELERQGKVKAP